MKACSDSPGLKKMFSERLLDNLCGEKMMEKNGRGKNMIEGGRRSRLGQGVAVWAMM
jgi:hypothetical protein